MELSKFLVKTITVIFQGSLVKTKWDNTIRKIRRYIYIYRFNGYNIYITYGKVIYHDDRYGQKQMFFFYRMLKNYAP